MNIYNAKNNSMPEQVLENKENIKLLNTGKQDNLIAGNGITIENNVISTYGNGAGESGTVIYDNEQGSSEFLLTLTVGKIYEFYLDVDVYFHSGRQIVKFMYDGLRNYVSVFNCVNANDLTTDIQIIIYNKHNHSVKVTSLSYSSISANVYKVIEY